ncbi:MAG: hypothetical protein KJ630_21585 [Proteobacteria bacterium]|nr:hypothetical protein [Pseudomonadota bacterium]
MTRSIKAMLLSAFVFPGAGHFFLKRHICGLVLTSAAIASLYFLISGVAERALQITEKIQRGEVQLDVVAITELISTQPTGTEAQLFDIASAVLIITWLIGIVDSYRVGRIKGKEKVADDQYPNKTNKD